MDLHTPVCSTASAAYSGMASKQLCLTETQSPCIHIHDQLISICPVCGQEWATVFTHLFYLFSMDSGRGRAQAHLL